MSKEISDTRNGVNLIWPLRLQLLAPSRDDHRRPALLFCNTVTRHKDFINKVHFLRLILFVPLSWTKFSSTGLA